jgi:hypothetical protein
MTIFAVLLSRMLAWGTYDVNVLDVLLTRTVTVDPADIVLGAGVVVTVTVMPRARDVT